MARSREFFSYGRTWSRAFLVIFLVAAGAGAAGCSNEDSIKIPTGAECSALAERESPELEARAAEILNSVEQLDAWADCNSGGYAAVAAVVDEGPETIARRMGRFGSVEELEDSECLKYLSPRECDRVWRFTPRGSGTTYRVSLPNRTPGEFSMSVDRPIGG